MTSNDEAAPVAPVAPDWAEPQNLQADVFVAHARALAQLEDMGDSSFRDGLNLLCAGLRSDMMTRGGRRLLGGNVVSYLVNRLRVEDWHAQHPELAGMPVDAPIVILGLPRTGTTALSYLLDQDPQWRSLLNWEAVQSAPPAASRAEVRSDPRCLELLEFQKAVLPALDPAPPHWEWADGPTECTFLLAQDFKAAMWESRVPNAAYRDFISTIDMSSAYRWHRRVLQVLQHRAPGRWCLKMPAHAFFIDGLLSEYPDARIVWTHRDPATSAASFMNLTAFSHTLSMGEPDIGWIRDNVAPRLVAQVERCMDRLADRLASGDVFHWHYDAYRADPLAQIEPLYEWLGAPLTSEVRDAMESWLNEDPLEASRRSSYAAEDFGFTRSQLHDMFRPYIDRFSVALDD